MSNKDYNNVIDIVDILKKASRGEGSRGGKVIGHTKSGKPIYEKVSHEGHSEFASSDHRDAMNHHYDKVEHHNKQASSHREIVSRMNKKIAEKKKQNPGYIVPKEAKAKMQELADKANNHAKQASNHMNQAKHHMAVANKKNGHSSPKVSRNVYSTKKKDIKEAQTSIDKLRGERKVQKSEQAHDDTYESISTHDFSVDEAATKDCPLLSAVESAMEGFQYGDAPKEIAVNNNTLYLSKVDDGLYSGYVTKRDSDGTEENALKLSKQTLPALVQMIKATELYKEEAPIQDESDMEEIAEEIKEELEEIQEKKEHSYEDILAIATQIAEQSANITINVAGDLHLKKSKEISMDKKDLIEEHKRLITVLESESKKDDKVEAKKQKKELEEYKKQ